MTDMIEATLQRLAKQLSGRLSRPGDDNYAAATAIWAKPVGRMPRAVVHCRTSQDVQSAIRAARDCYFRCRCAAEATTGPVVLFARESSST
jgi:hypothetical protein